MTSTVLHGRYAALSNMSRALELMTTLIERERHLPGIGMLHGRSGLGKSVAAAFVTAETNAVYIEARHSWTTKYFLTQIAKELGAEPAKTIPTILEQVVEGLAMQNRPLIIDEADHVVTKRYIENIRDIYELSRAPLLLIGEEHLPEKLKEWERIDNRVLSFVRAEPATIEDGKRLRDLYCKKIDIADDLVEHFVRQTRGVVRRIAVNLQHAQQVAQSEGWLSLDRESWGNRPVYVGRAEHGEQGKAAA